MFVRGVSHTPGSRFSLRDRPMVGHDKNGNIAIAETDYKTENHFVRYGSLEEQATNYKTVSVPEPPRAIHVYDTAVYLGFSSSVGWIDFSSSEPKYERICERVERRNWTTARKSFDLFTRRGDLLIVIDNGLRPFDVITFHLAGENHHPVRRDSLRLAQVGIGRYTSASIAGEDLLLLYQYGGPIYNGAVQELCRIPLRCLKVDAQLGFSPTEVTAAYLSGWEAMDTKRQTTTSKQVTRWRDMSIRGDSVLFAAGSRGLLELPTRFQTNNLEGKEITFGAPFLIHGEFPVQSVFSREEDLWVTLGKDTMLQRTKQAPQRVLVKVGNDFNFDRDTLLVDISNENGEILDYYALPGKFRLLD